MNRINGKPLGDIVPPRGGSGKAAPEKCECNIGMTFEELERTWKGRGGGHGDRKTEEDDEQ